MNARVSPPVSHAAPSSLRGSETLRRQNLTKVRLLGAAGRELIAGDADFIIGKEGNDCVFFLPEGFQGKSKLASMVKSVVFSGAVSGFPVKQSQWSEESDQLHLALSQMSGRARQLAEAV